jgi:hypothetical protein
MTRKHSSQNQTTRLAPLLVGVLVVLVALAALAQKSGSAPSFRYQNEDAVRFLAQRQGIGSTSMSGVKGLGLGPMDPGLLFFPPVTYATGGHNPHSAAVADVNGDGNLDLIVANQGNGLSEGSVAVLLGNGDGTFQPALDYDSGGANAYSVAVADVNGDGKPDLVVANGCDGNDCSTGGVSVLLGNGDGTFQAAVTYSVGNSAFYESFVVVADVNGDGKFDLAVKTEPTACCTNNGSVSVLLGNGDGTFKTAVTYASGGFGPGSVAIADVNGDGRPDLLVANYCASTCSYPPTEGSVGVLLGNGDGTFRAAVTYPSGGNGTISVTVADVNGDGNPDLLAASCGPKACAPGRPGGVVGVLLGEADGTFQSAVAYGAANSPYSVVVADLNGDGKLDVVVANWGTSDGSSNNGAVSVLLGNGDGTFQTVLSYSSGGAEAPSVAVADLNGDGKPDIVLACIDDALTGSQGVVSVLLNNAPFDITPPVITLSATPKVLWPPNGKMTPVTVLGTITDTGSGVNLNSVVYTVKDEYGVVQPHGAITLGPAGGYSFTILLQASRLGADLDGRRYTVTVRAKDNAGNAGSKTSVVTVPHDRRN